MKVSPRMIRIMQTFNIDAFVFCMGLSFSAYGTALLDLAEVFNTSVELISYTMTTRAVGSIVAGIIGGATFRFLNGQLAITSCVLLSGIALILMPLGPNILFLHVLSFLIGCLTTLGEIGSHVWLQIIWKEESGPQLQLYNLLFGVGGIIAPFICEPFLSSRIIPSSDITEDPSEGTLAGVDENNAFNRTLTTAVSVTTEIPEDAGSVSRIHIAYIILGGFFVLNALSFAFSYKLDSTDPKPDKNPVVTQDELPKKSKYIIITLLAIYMLLGVADEITLTAFLPTFVVRNSNLRFTKSEAAYLSSAFWLSYTVSRLLATILSLKLSPGKIMVFYHGIYMIATFGMLAFINTSRISAWIGSIMVSFGLSPFFGNVTIWGVQYILLTHKYMSLLMVCVCVGAMAPSAFIGQVIDTQPMVMMWSHTGLATALTVCACILLLYGKTSLLREFEKKKLDRNNTETVASDRYSF